MTPDCFIHIPNKPRLRNPGGKRRLSDIRFTPFDRQPAAITQPGEPWVLNGYHMASVMVVRGETEVTVATFRTARDAAAAVQSRLIAERVCALARQFNGDDAGLGAAVRQVLSGYGR